MISILIPTFNHSVVELVTNIHKQCVDSKIQFEILIYDDCSTNQKIKKSNEILTDLPMVSYKCLESNMGRSFVRNRLSEKAKYKWLLFMDADVSPKSNLFIKKYIDNIKINSEVIYGGVEYDKKKPNNDTVLRWKYGKKRESKSKIKRKKNCYLNLLTCNFLIKKNVMLDHPFNEKISKNSNEDSLFSYNLKFNNIKVKHIDNPVLHIVLDSAYVFLKKSLEYAESSLFFVENELMDKDYMKITKFYYKIKKMKLVPLFSIFFLLLRPLIRRQFNSKNPSLLLFDLYRISFICHKKNHQCLFSQ